MEPNELLHVIMSRLDQIQSDMRARREINSPDSPVLNFEEALQFLNIIRGTLVLIAFSDEDLSAFQGWPSEFLMIFSGNRYYVDGAPDG